MQSVHLRKYGVETTIPFELYEVDGINFRVNAADGGADCSIMKDEGAENTCSNDFVDEGTGYSITLTTGEMTAARIVLYLIDTDGTKVYLDKSIVIETYGNASAQHAFDLDTTFGDITVVAALMAHTGFTAGGTTTYEELLKILAAWAAGTWRDKPTDSTKQELLDADDDATIILTQTLLSTTPYKSVDIA